MLDIEMYSSSTCPFCIRAKQLLAAKGHQVSRELKIDRDPAERTRMIARTGRRSVPQIFINGQHIGGFDDLAALDRAAKLDILLAKG